MQKSFRIGGIELTLVIHGRRKSCPAEVPNSVCGRVPNGEPISLVYWRVLTQCTHSPISTCLKMGKLDWLHQKTWTHWKMSSGKIQSGNFDQVVLRPQGYSEQHSMQSTECHCPVLNSPGCPQRSQTVSASLMTLATIWRMGSGYGLRSTRRIENRRPNFSLI